MAIKKVSFKNKNGDLLVARMELPIDREPISYALFAHCFTCNKNLGAVRNISKALTLSGFAVLRFDFTGLGESEGDFADTNFSSNVEDLLDAAKFMENEYSAPSLIIGHSLGGAAAIFAGNIIESIQAIATIGAPSSPDHVQHLFGSNVEKIKKEGTVTMDIGGRPFTIKKQFLEDISDKNMPNIVKKLGKALLIMHSPQDSTVGIKNASDLYSYASHPKSFVSLDGADHLLTAQVMVKLDGQGFTTDIKAGKHIFRADEPISVGGNDFGPAPYDFLLSSLGSCTAMTLRMYADRKKWDLQEVEVHLNFTSDTDPNTKEKTSTIHKTITIEGDLDEAQKNRLIEISERCPVHKTLMGTINIQTV